MLRIAPESRKDRSSAKFEVGEVALSLDEKIETRYAYARGLGQYCVSQIYAEWFAVLR